MNKYMLKTQCKPTDSLYWLLLALNPVIVAIYSISKSSIQWLIGYIILFLISQLIIFRFLCTHCPHYCKDSKMLNCLFLWNFPKLFKRRPGPWKLIDKIMVSFSTILICVFPIFWVWSNKLLLVLYVIGGFIFISTLKKFECKRCIYFHCPNNIVPKEIRKEFES